MCHYLAPIPKPIRDKQMRSIQISYAFTLLLGLTYAWMISHDQLGSGIVLAGGFLLAALPAIYLLREKKKPGVSILYFSTILLVWLGVFSYYTPPNPDYPTLSLMNRFLGIGCALIIPIFALKESAFLLLGIGHLIISGWIYARWGINLPQLPLIETIRITIMPPLLAEGIIILMGYLYVRQRRKYEQQITLNDQMWDIFNTPPLTDLRVLLVDVQDPQNPVFINQKRDIQDILGYDPRQKDRLPKRKLIPQNDEQLYGSTYDTYERLPWIEVGITGKAIKDQLVHLEFSDPERPRRELIECAYPINDIHGRPFRVLYIAIDRQLVIPTIPSNNPDTSHPTLREHAPKPQIARDHIVLGAFAHELKTPLHSLTRGLNALLTNQKTYQLNSELIERLHYFQSAAGDLEYQLSNLSDGYLLEEARIPLNREQLRLTYEVQSVINQMMPLSEERQVILEVNCLVPEKDDWVWGDRHRIRQVVYNLVWNAIKHSPKPGKVEIKMYIPANDHKIQISIRDEGQGIALEDQSTVFDSYYRNVTAKTSTGGLGFGLTISRSIIKSHDGHIQVESQRGKGSTFSFTLPMVSRT
jgi:signal transduction histidine kinase